MYGSEKPLSKRGRLTIVVLLWVVGIPLFIGLFVLMGWVAVILFVAAVWATFDYLNKGDFFGAVDRMFTAESRVVDGLASEDKRRRR
jgi:hypothetical protein